jgi:hypothetical protein
MRPFRILMNTHVRLQYHITLKAPAAFAFCLFGANGGGEMRIVAFVEEKILIENILRHCKIWQERKPHPPPKPPPNQLIPPAMVERSILAFDFFERNCA